MKDKRYYYVVLVGDDMVFASYNYQYAVCYCELMLKVYPNSVVKMVHQYRVPRGVLIL